MRTRQSREIRYLFFIIVGFLLVGCASSKLQLANGNHKAEQGHDFKSVRDAWVGHKLADVLLLMGNPKTETELDNQNYVISYRKTRVAGLHVWKRYSCTANFLMSPDDTVLRLSISEYNATGWSLYDGVCKGFIKSPEGARA